MNTTDGYGWTGNGTGMASPLGATAVEGPCLASIVSKEAEAVWEYRIPEGLSCDEGMFKSHAHPIVDWHGPDANGTIWHEWQTNDEDFEIINSYERAEEFGIIFIQGIHYRVFISPAEHGLDLRFTATNLSDQTLHNVDNFPCLAAKSENFWDNDLERTFIVTEGGMTPLRETDRGTGDPRRTHFHIPGQRPRRFFGEPFWGQPSKTKALNGAILRTRIDGKFTIGTAWENVTEIFHNEDPHHCIHSVATLGDINPGETKTACGKIVVVEGGVEEAMGELTD